MFALEGAVERRLGLVARFPGDARDEDDMIALFDQVEAEVGPVEVAVFNIGANVNFPISETTVRVYTKVWEMACLGGFLMGREAAKRMAPRGRGTIIFTGASASVKGYAQSATFAMGKFALRGLAQSMARELAPQNIHVAHVVIDGAIDTAFIAQNFPERYALKDQDGILNPDHIAEAWAVRKPTDKGHVTSLEAYDRAGSLIIQFFGQRQEGTDERTGWRELVESLPRLNRSNAA